LFSTSDNSDSAAAEGPTDSAPTGGKQQSSSSSSSTNYRTFVKNIAIPSNFDSLSEIDFINWENSYFCLHRRDNIEHLARLAYFYRSVVHFSSSASYIPFQCQSSSSSSSDNSISESSSLSSIFGSSRSSSASHPPRNSENWKPSSSFLEKASKSLRFSHYDITEYRNILSLWNSESSSISRYIASLDTKYKGLVFHGYNMWGKSKTLCLGISQFNYSMEIAKNYSSSASSSLRLFSAPTAGLVGISSSQIKSYFNWDFPKLHRWIQEQFNYTKGYRQFAGNLKRLPKKFLKSRDNPFTNNIPTKATDSGGCDAASFFASSNTCSQNKGPKFVTAENILEYGVSKPSFSVHFAKSSSSSSSSSSSRTIPDKNISSASTLSIVTSKSVRRRQLLDDNSTPGTSSSFSSSSSSSSSTTTTTTTSAVASPVSANPILFHPSKALHLLRAEIIIFNYYMILLDAIMTFEAELDMNKTVIELFPLLTGNFACFRFLSIL
jgi:hypothetical protein